MVVLFSSTIIRMNFESLELNNKIVWRIFECECLKCLLLFVALETVPCVIIRESLFLREGIQTERKSREV